MPEVVYGDRVIEYTIQQKDGLRSLYVSVERSNGVVLKGKPVTVQEADKLILKKARWILKKLDLVQSIKEGDIVTGSRIPYLGRRYYIEIFLNESLPKTRLEFNHSKFKIIVNRKDNQQPLIHQALEEYFKEKAEEKITPRLRKWSKKTGFNFNDLMFRHMDKRWGSCTEKNNIVINIEAVKLPYSLIDYLLVHELVHTKIKNHSKAFWAELSKHMSNWQELDKQMYGMKV